MLVSSCTAQTEPQAFRLTGGDVVFGSENLDQDLSGENVCMESSDWVGNGSF